MRALGTISLVGLAIAALAAPVAAQTATPSLPPLTLFGKAELSPGVPCAGCGVVVEGVPLAATTDTAGNWSISGIPPGRWDLKLTSGTFTTRFQCGGMSADHVSCGTVAIARPGGISGRITFATTSDYDIAIVAVPELGVFTELNCGGGYLLPGVAPGWRKLVVSTNTQSKELWVFVSAGQVTMKMNLTFATVVPPPPGA